MKYTWEEEDIIAGRYVCKPLREDEKRFEPTGWTAKWTYKIGFIPTHGVTLICMADGLVHKPTTALELATQLNRDGMIPMPHAWLLKHIEYTRDLYTQPNS